jgi:UDP-N-acetylmuramate dehydrogenase
MFLEENKLLAPLTTFKIGGPARYFVAIKSMNNTKEAIEFAKKNGLKTFVLAGGSNLLVNDNGFDGLVIKPEINFTRIIKGKNSRDIRLNSRRIRGIIVEIGAGKLMPELVSEMCNLGYKGLEQAGGLPGTLGGAIRGNAGCFGWEIKNNILEVQAINLKNKKIKIFTNRRIARTIRLASPSARFAGTSARRAIRKGRTDTDNMDCNFSYRDSYFKKNPEWLILSAKMIFKKENKDELLKLMRGKINYRKKFQPLEFPNAGSIFKNFPLTQATKELKQLAEENKVIKTDPFPVIPAAFIIDQCNLKGKQMAGAKISAKHPNFIINFNNAQSQDVIDLINFVKNVVYKKFKIILEEEIQII